MMTIITRVKLREGSTEQWDRAMHARVEAARGAKGWISAQLLKGVDESLERAIVGVWESKEDWATWHNEDAFRETRAQLSGVEERAQESVWFEVAEDVD
ncbi:MAG: antibiotic biosynthesis monooxygenase family protein [Nocardioidaceae bacterium]